MMRAVTKPVIVEVAQWRGDNESEIIAVGGDDCVYFWSADTVTIKPKDIRPGARLSRGDWLIRNGATVYRMADIDFRASFDLVPDMQRATKH